MVSRMNGHLFVTFPILRQKSEVFWHHLPQPGNILYPMITKTFESSHLMSVKIRAKDIPANFDGYRKNKRRRVDSVPWNVTELAKLFPEFCLLLGQFWVVVVQFLIVFLILSCFPICWFYYHVSLPLSRCRLQAQARAAARQTKHFMGILFSF